jgi:hypothetical protein
VGADLPSTKYFKEKFERIENGGIPQENEGKRRDLDSVRIGN